MNDNRKFRKIRAQIDKFGVISITAEINALVLSLQMIKINRNKINKIITGYNMKIN